VMAFVNNDEINELMTSSSDKFADAASTRQRISIVELLREYGKNEDSKLLDETIGSENPTLSRIAKLVQSYNRTRDVLSSAALNVIKHEIIKSLSIESENDTDLESGNSTFVGIESATTEFKTSVIYDQGKVHTPNPNVQMKNILKEVCAFLNSRIGGNLYVGVNDQGYVSGIKNDMDYLKCSEIDTYMRYIQDSIIEHLGADAAIYVLIEPLYDNNVVVLHVKPHPYSVVELDGEAYIRINSESRLMPESTRQELINERMMKNREKAANISWLLKAYQQKKCVILHRYASSNRGKISDRHVEPYKVFPDENLIFAYDIDEKDNRVFSISRIDYVELLENEPWGHTSLHQDMEVDAFHLSGTRGIKVLLKLDLMAKNLMVEEFPRTTDQISRDKNDDNVWYYKDEVRNIVGIARFYMGLADHIEIIEAPELVDFVKKLLKKFPIQP